MFLCLSVARGEWNAIDIQKPLLSRYAISSKTPELFPTISGAVRPSTYVVSRLLTELGHGVIVAHTQKVQLITRSNRKDDHFDARTLARIDPGLLGPVRHRSAKAQIHLTVVRARAVLVSARTALVNAAAG